MASSDQENILKQLSEITGTVPITFETQKVCDQLIAQLRKEFKYASDYKINQTLVEIIEEIKAKPEQD